MWPAPAQEERHTHKKLTNKPAQNFTRLFSAALFAVETEISLPTLLLSLVCAGVSFYLKWFYHQYVSVCVCVCVCLCCLLTLGTGKIFVNHQQYGAGAYFYCYIYGKRFENKYAKVALAIWHHAGGSTTVNAWKRICRWERGNQRHGLVRNERKGVR